MAATAPAHAAQFQTQLTAAMQLASQAVAPKTRKGRGKIFRIWQSFCRAHNVRESLADVPEGLRLNYILVFGMSYRQTGQRGKQVRAGTVCDALLAVGEGITHLGAKDPRKHPNTGKLAPIYESFLKTLSDQDDPSTRAYPVNASIVRHMRKILDTKHKTEGQANSHVIDLAIVGFFWLLRPSEYLDSNAKTRSQAFRLCDIHFTVDGQQALATTLTLNDENCRKITAATLTFSDQKSGVRGEQIGHRATNDPLFCPCQALARIARHLRRHRAPPLTPIHTYCTKRGNHSKTTSTVTPQFITNGPRYAARDLQRPLALIPP